MQMPPFSLGRHEKSQLLSCRLLELTRRHMSRCPEYASMMRGIGFDAGSCKSYYDIPFLPVSLFKELELRSIPQEEIFKVLTSSGTTGRAVSRIYLDRHTADMQQRALVKIVSDFTGASRLPMLIVDSPAAVRDRETFSARGAGIIGFSIFGSDRAYALNENMEIDIGAVSSFLEKHKGRRILLFGFTYIVWLHFYKEIVKLDRKFDLRNGILIHGGGWKKMAGESVSRDEFKRRLAEACGLEEAHDYYGMVEQTGCVCMECGHGNLHASSYSDIITRRHTDFAPCAFGEAGIIQAVSALPESYPGHSLLTEDEGVILGEDDCACGRKGKYFKINGRLKMAEARGCSDTYATGG